MKAPFRDRAHAGRELATLLEHFRGTAALVPSFRLDVAPVSKVLYPGTTESGYGAVAYDGRFWLDDARMAGHGLAPAEVKRALGVIVAVPTAHQAALDAISKGADGAYCPNVRAGKSFTVADAGAEWR